MRRAEALAILAAHKDDLRALHVASLSIFGSVARDEARPDSDVDLLVEFDKPVGYFHLFETKERLEEIFGCPVDLATEGALHPRMRSAILSECIRAA